MNRKTLALMVSLACSTGSSVAGSSQHSGAESAEYCKGLVVGGLGSKQVSGMSRTELWKAWSYLIRSGALPQNTAANQLQAGLDQFQNATDAAAAAVY